MNTHSKTLTKNPTEVAGDLVVAVVVLREDGAALLQHRDNKVPDAEQNLARRLRFQRILSSAATSKSDCHSGRRGTSVIRCIEVRS